LRILDEALEHLPEGADLPGRAAFKLYDTFGFPLDLTQDALREMGRGVDVSGFDAAMAEQKAKARAAWAGSGETADSVIWFDVAERAGATEFLGYETEIAEGQIMAIFVDGAEVAHAKAGDIVQVVVNQTPFYAEAGGQVGDTGLMKTDTGAARITDTRRTAGVTVHFAEVTEGTLEIATGTELQVDHDRRQSIRANHSATHLLHEALRQALGEHVAQRGSLNAPDRLRFDFSHSAAMTPDEIARVEAEVNAFIRQNSAVETRIMTPDDARAIGAQALFGEKYGDEVRVVSMGKAPTGKGLKGQTYSIELCGGTHVRRTGEIGLFVLLGESASSAGVRRIEALTGQAALEHLRRRSAVSPRSPQCSKPAPRTPRAGCARCLTIAALQAEVAELRRKLALGGGGTESGEKPKTVNGIAFLSQVLDGVPGRDLPALIDALKARVGSGAVLLISEAEGKAAVAGGVTPDLTTAYRPSISSARRSRRLAARVAAAAPIWHRGAQRAPGTRRRHRRRRTPAGRIGHAGFLDRPRQGHGRRGLWPLREDRHRRDRRARRRVHRPRRALRAA
jgi:alanyl-tRNA synthetase